MFKNIRHSLCALIAAMTVVACGLASAPIYAQSAAQFPAPILVYANRLGGKLSLLNVTAPVVVKASGGAVMRILVIAAGSSGSLTLNDTTTTGAATTANEIFTIAQASLTVGQVITIEFPCQSGITVSAVPGGSPQFAISFT